MPDEQPLITEVKADVALAQQAAAFAQKKDWLGLAKLAFENKGAVETQVQEVEKVLPYIKQGYKTTEFWLVIGYFALNTFCTLKGISLPLSEDAPLGAIIGSYVASRHFTKTQ